jgi:indole-3-glycerol phosphate synthase
VPDNVHLVSESGINTNADISRLSQAGIKTYLVGESLMRHEDVTRATQTLLWGEKGRG